MVPRTPPGLHFKGFWRVPGLRFPMVFAAPCALLPNVFFDAVTIIFAFTGTIFLFFRCGGLCAAHGIPEITCLGGGNMPTDTRGRLIVRPSEEPCWHYFSYLGPSWGHSAPLAAFWITVGRFLCVLDRSGLDFEGFWERSGSPQALFFEVFQRIWKDVGLFFALAPNTQKPRKNTGFSMIFAYRAC